MLVRFFLIIFTFVELNCENLFDFFDDPLKNDDEYTENSLRHWDKRKYYEKLYNIGKEIISCAERPDEGGEGHMPDMIALCEVENDSVMVGLTKRSMLWSYHYEYVITHSPDERGINVALMYDPNSYKLLENKSFQVELPNKRPTRDILYTKGLIINLDTLHVFVVHSPSRRGGEKETRKDRLAVANILVSKIDSLNTSIESNNITQGEKSHKLSKHNHIIVAGDFNDYGNVPPLKKIESSGLLDLTKKADALFKEIKCNGTYYFDEEWNMLDHIFASPTISDLLIDCKINNNPKLLEQNQYGIYIPKRSYKGYKYNHGFSDHLPLIVRFNINGNF